MSIDKALKDKLEIAHPQLGTIKVYLVYEKLTTVCLLCAKLGHDDDHCPDQLKLQRLQFNTRFTSRPELAWMGQPKIKGWVNDSALLPLIEPSQPHSNRPHNQDQTYPSHNQGPHQQFGTPFP